MVEGRVFVYLGDGGVEIDFPSYESALVMVERLGSGKIVEIDLVSGV